jgi:hypothetical protein
VKKCYILFYRKYKKGDFSITYLTTQCMKIRKREGTPIEEKKKEG